MDFKSFAEVDRLTFDEYELLMQAAHLKQIDMDYRNHLQAFLNFSVQAKKKSGKKYVPVYRKFEKFYNYSAELKKAQKKKDNKSRFAGIGKLLYKGE